jgi:hypothetical protein
MTVPLLISLLVSAPFLYILARRPILRRLAVRNAVRRPREAALVVLGSMLGAAIITGSAVVGDTMDSSIRQVARQHLGPVDELVVARTADDWRTLGTRASLVATGDRRRSDLSSCVRLRHDRRKGRNAAHGPERACGRLRFRHREFVRR